MNQLDKMIAETQQWREYHVERRMNGVNGAGIEALACAIREKALRDARAAILAERKP